MNIQNIHNYVYVGSRVRCACQQFFSFSSSSSDNKLTKQLFYNELIVVRCLKIDSNPMKRQNEIDDNNDRPTASIYFDVNHDNVTCDDRRHQPSNGNPIHESTIARNMLMRVDGDVPRTLFWSTATARNPWNARNEIIFFNEKKMRRKHSSSVGRGRRKRATVWIQRSEENGKNKTCFGLVLVRVWCV